MFKKLSKGWWAYKTGVIDGWESPIELSVGMSWPDAENYYLNEIYDHGVNLGQFIGRLLKRR